jgi:TolB-like protein/DNA-binding winged helix-turn-helix (wHTH) protein
MDTSPKSFCFGPFKLRTRSRELYKHGLKLKLRPQPFQILIELLSRSGELVTREELRDKLWSSETFVDFEQSLNTSIKELRAALSDSAAEPVYVETVPRLGYRLIAPVEVIGSAAVREDLVPAGATVDAWLFAQGTKNKNRLRLGLSVAVLVAAAMIAVAGYLKFATSMFGRNAKAYHAVSSLVVLPLENLSGDPSQDAFATGLTDLLATELAKIPTLRVVSRTSAAYYQNHPVPIRQLSKELNVDAVLEGSMVRSGDKIRLSAQLIDARDDSHLWAENYERNVHDALSLQDDLSHSVSTALRKELVHSGPGSPTRSPNPAAMDAYLRGRAMMDAHTTSDIGRGIVKFQEAIRDDPDFAPPYAASARMYWLLTDFGIEPIEVLPLMKSASDKALELDDNLADAHAVRGLVLIYLQNNWKGGEAEFHRALELNPGEGATHAYYDSGFLLPLGRYDEAIAELHRALELDPLSVEFNNSLGYAFYIARRYREAETQFKKVLQMEPSFPGASWMLMELYEQQRRWPEASDQFQKILAGVKNELVPPGKVGIHKELSPQEYWKERVAMQEEMVRDLSDCVDLAIVYARSGQKKKALDALDLAAAKNDSRLKYVRVEPAFDSLRDEPRFKELIKRMHFPQT